MRERAATTRNDISKQMKKTRERIYAPRPMQRERERENKNYNEAMDEKDSQCNAMLSKLSTKNCFAFILTMESRFCP